MTRLAPRPARRADDWASPYTMTVIAALGAAAGAAGPRAVHVLHDGPGQTAGLETYTTVLRAAGCHVVADAPHSTRHRLIITRP